MARKLNRVVLSGTAANAETDPLHARGHTDYSLFISVTGFDSSLGHTFTVGLQAAPDEVTFVAMPAADGSDMTITQDDLGGGLTSGADDRAAVFATGIATEFVRVVATNVSGDFDLDVAVMGAGNTEGIDYRGN